MERKLMYDKGMKKESSEKHVIFKPMMDWWVAILVGLILLIVGLSIPMVIWQDLPLIATAPAVIFLIITFLLIVDRAVFTKYSLEKDGLRIYGQIRHTFLPYRNMKTIRNGNVLGLFSTSKQKRFALSANCFIISLQGLDWQRVSVSPEHRQAFLDALLENIDHERSTRASKHKTR
jgi:hypothetical protein